MTYETTSFPRFPVLVLSLFALLFFAGAGIRAQNVSSAASKDLYEQVKTASMTGGSAEVSGLVLNRDRAEMTFNGTFYFSSSVDGHVTGAVFIGNGTFKAAVPAGKFEHDNVRRMIGADKVESDFRTAVLRFSDDTFAKISQNRHESAPDQHAQKLITDSDSRILKETGANIPARLALSLLNNEKPGFFFATFDGGSRGHFSLLLDYQSRIPVANFDINAGEKGMIFKYQNSLSGNDIWMAFYGLEDYEQRKVEYSDVHNLIDIGEYKMDIDLTDPGHSLKLVSQIGLKVLYPNLRAISFQIGESLGEDESQRLKRQLRFKRCSAKR